MAFFKVNLEGSSEETNGEPTNILGGLYTYYIYSFFFQLNLFMFYFEYILHSSD